MSSQVRGDHPDEAVIGRLRAAGCVAAEEEADELMSRAKDDETLEEWIGRREQGEPLAWIIGSTRFCGHTVHVDRGVYVPRSQSEELARRAAALLVTVAQRTQARAADLCTGAGTIAVHLAAEAPAATVVGVDIDRKAVACARRNGIGAVQADLSPEPFPPATFDVVTAVPPYVPTGQLRLLAADVQRYEPRMALDGGDDGLDVTRRVVMTAARLLRPGGWLLLELGGEQDGILQPTLRTSGFGSVSSWSDEDGDLRGLAARLGRA